MTVTPMFPLGSVLLPSVVLPLHVFEPRYRALVQDCLAGDHEFGVVLIERGSEVGGGDQRTDVGTMARIVEAAELPDGRWALASVGLRRIRVHEWLEDDPYPRAVVGELEDPPSTAELDSLVRTTAVQLRRVLALATEMGMQVAPATQELSDDPVLATYQLAALSPCGPADQQRLLEAVSAEERARSLAALLAEEETFLTRQLELQSQDDDGGDAEG